jgi:hypothetical protein
MLNDNDKKPSRKNQENGKCKETALYLLPFWLVLKPASFENYEIDFFNKAAPH